MYNKANNELGSRGDTWNKDHWTEAERKTIRNWAESTKNCKNDRVGYCGGGGWTDHCHSCGHALQEEPSSYYDKTRVQYKHTTRGHVSSPPCGRCGKTSGHSHWCAGSAVHDKNDTVGNTGTLRWRRYGQPTSTEASSSRTGRSAFDRSDRRAPLRSRSRSSSPVRRNMNDKYDFDNTRKYDDEGIDFTDVYSKTDSMRARRLSRDGSVFAPERRRPVDSSKRLSWKGMNRV